MLAWIVERLMLVRPNEHRSTLVSFAIAFLLMASYFVLRPARERPSLFHTPPTTEDPSMTLFKAICASLLLAMCTFVSASESDSQAIEREAAAFLDNYLSVYNRRFGHPERSAQFRSELGELVHMPFLQAPPTGKPLVPESLEAFTASFEGFVSMLEEKNVDRLEWQQVQLHVLTPNKVLANNIGRGLTVNGEVAYETISLYLLYRGEDGWKIAMFSPYYINNALSLERK